jgi:hypothetical protein
MGASTYRLSRHLLSQEVRTTMEHKVKKSEKFQWAMAVIGGLLLVVSVVIYTGNNESGVATVLLVVGAAMLLSTIIMNDRIIGLKKKWVISELTAQGYTVEKGDRPRLDSKRLYMDCGKFYYPLVLLKQDGPWRLFWESESGERLLVSPDQLNQIRIDTHDMSSGWGRRLRGGGQGKVLA